MASFKPNDREGRFTTLKLAACDYTYPKLPWEQTLRMARDLGAEAVDVALFAGRSHLDVQEVFTDLPRAARRVNDALAANGLRIADAFGQPGRVFEENAVNHPEPSVRQAAAEFFYRLLEFALRCNGSHMSLLPGVHFKTESEQDSLKRSVDELAWRVEAAAKVGVTLSIEPHVGSLVPTPAAAGRLLDLTPGLTVTLDYAHFTCQGIPDAAIEPLLGRTSHFHARGACKGKLQSSMAENTIDFDGVLRAMQKVNYRGFVVLEYVWTEWMEMNRVDNLSETIILRDLLRALDAASLTTTQKV
jgi:sugar phosphate isomerase/epimerase